MNEASNAGSIAVPPTRSERWLLAAVVVVGLLVSGIIAKDRLTWLLEVIWAMVGLTLIAWRWSRFPLTRLLCWLLLLHALVLIHGGAYTYSLTPGGFWLQELLGTERNPWDRLGHWMQGFVPAILARADHADAFVSNGFDGIESLPQGARACGAITPGFRSC